MGEATTEQRPSLVDVAERALREWLAPGRHRPGDRLPPEHDLASMLGVSRGTLRVALERLERTGEIVRRQGSGTFVGRVTAPGAFSEGLEVLESYASLARRAGRKTKVRDLRVGREPLTAGEAAALGLDEGAEAVVVERTLIADGHVAAHMRDAVAPSVDLPDLEDVARAIERGDMVLDVLISVRVPIAFARTRVLPRLVSAGDDLGRALDVKEPTAVLEILETMHLTSGEALQHATDVFLPTGIDLHVIRGFAAERPEVIPPRD